MPTTLTADLHHQVGQPSENDSVKQTMRMLFELGRANWLQTVPDNGEPRKLPWQMQMACGCVYGAHDEPSEGYQGDYIHENGDLGCPFADAKKLFDQTEAEGKAENTVIPEHMDCCGCWNAMRGQSTVGPDALPHCPWHGDLYPDGRPQFVNGTQQAPPPGWTDPVWNFLKKLPPELDSKSLIPDQEWSVQPPSKETWFKVGIGATVFAHILIWLGMIVSCVLLPFKVPLVIAFPIICLVVNLAFRTDICPVTRLENYFRRKLGWKDIPDLAHYHILCPLLHGRECFK
jgi:hypothetical protein